MKRVQKITGSICIFLLALCLTSQAFAWWNPEWDYRAKIDLDGSPAGADISGQLVNVPLLIRLHTGNFDFTKAKEDGSDIRFVSGDDKELLKHHFENFDSLEELALVWVKMPKLMNGPNSIYIYYGNEEAGLAQDEGGTYDVGQSAVFHFDELEGLPADSTAYSNNAASFKGTQGLPALIGRGISLLGSMDSLILPGTSFKIDKGFTFSTWVRISQPQTHAPLFTYKKDKIGLQLLIEETSIQASLHNGRKNYQTEPGGTLTMNNWHHVAVSGVGGGDLSVYLDGKVVASVKLPQQLPDITAEPIVGDGDLGGSFSGELDELRLSNMIRSSEWIAFAEKTQNPSASIAGIGIGEANDTGGLPLSYLSTIAANISLDGWLVIGILLIIAALSWFVMLAKAYIFYTMQKGNKDFRRTFDRLIDHTSFEHQDDQFEGAPLYRIYQAGHQILHGSDSGQLPEAALSKSTEERTKNFQFAIERSYMHESQRMNSWLTIMTLAISGGPFLGLLGTVWGVMNTFAAMAEAGEANIMAIAPGIASALATTVFGLIVAIPALFGYNFLVSKIKAITQDLNIFLDEYAIKIQEINGRESI